MFICLEVLWSYVEHDFMPSIHSILMVLILTSPAGRTPATPSMNMLSGSCGNVPNYPLFAGPLDSVPHCIASF